MGGLHFSRRAVALCRSRRNYRFFFFFVLGANTVAFTVLCGSVMVCVSIAQAAAGSVSMVIALAPVAIFLVIYTAIILMTVGGLLAYHVGLISTNLTTNESIKGVYAGRRNPHDRGVAANWRAFLALPWEGRGSYVTGDWEARHAAAPGARV